MQNIAFQSNKSERVVRYARRFHPRYLAVFLVVLVTVTCYLPALDNGFVNWDDERYIIGNTPIRSLDTALVHWAFTSFHAANWHPLTWLAHAVDYGLWGSNPFGHHLSSIVVHGLNTALVMFLVAQLMVAYPRFGGIAAGVAGLIFGLHPLHVESVAWASEYKDLLCAGFFLSSILFYLRHARQGGRAPYLAALACFACALLSKPMAVSLPVVLMVLDGYPLRRLETAAAIRTSLTEKLPFFALSLASSLVTLAAQKPALASIEAIPATVRVLVACQSTFLYLKKLTLPFDLAPLYRYPQNPSWLAPEYIVPLLFFLVVTAFCIRMRKSHPYLLAGWAYYLATLLPVVGVVQVGSQPMADRYTYLPTLGPILIFSGLVSATLHALERRAPYGRIVQVALAAAMVGILTGFAVLTVQQIRVWKSGETLWTRVIELQPDYPKPYLHRGNLYRVQQRWDLALRDFSTAIALAPFGDPNYYNDRGIIYARTGKFFEAKQDFEVALMLAPDNVVYRRNFLAAEADLRRHRPAP